MGHCDLPCLQPLARRGVAAVGVGSAWGDHGVPANPQDSAKEILRYADTKGVVAVYLPTAGVSPLWGHRQYDPILAAIEESGLPAVLHSVSLVSPTFPTQMEQFENLFAKQVIGHSFAMMANLISIMHTGVPARYPKLKLVFTEAGISWVPGMMWRMDRYYNEYRRLVPFLEDRPSEYMKRQMWFATQPVEEPDDPAHMVEMINHFGRRGPRPLRFGSAAPRFRPSARHREMAPHAGAAAQADGRERCRAVQAAADGRRGRSRAPS